MRHKVSFFSFLVIFIIVTCPIISMASEKNNEMMFGNNGEYGMIYGAEYDPDNGNTSKWLTIAPGENGVRIINEANQDIVMVDKHGGVYVNGTIYVNGEQIREEEQGELSLESGFLYLLIVISLCLNVYSILKK